MDCLMCRWNDLPNDIRQQLRGKDIRYATFVEFECGHMMATYQFDEYFKDIKQK